MPNHEPSPSTGPASGEVLIKVENVSKIFCRSFKRSLAYGVKDIARDLMLGGGRTEEDLMAAPAEDGSDLRAAEYWALREISFEVRRGECLGLIGSNGAGKTTLLRLINGLIKPDRGRITIKGRTAALIALNAGFNYVLTGRENIYVNGSIRGLTKREIDARMDEIIEFSGVGDFIDTPVQSYSSGMHVRLGFAVATALNPDILLIDEILAVGDAAFREKCLFRVGSIASKCAVIFVSHDQTQVERICDKCLYLEKGRRRFYGDLYEGMAQYNASGGASGMTDAKLSHASYIESAEILCTPDKALHKGEDLVFEIKIRARKDIAIDDAFIQLSRLDGNIAAYSSCVLHDLPKTREMTIQLRVANVRLHGGGYYVDFGLSCKKDKEFVVRCVRAFQFHMEYDHAGNSNYQPKLELAAVPA